MISLRGDAKFRSWASQRQSNSQTTLNMKCTNEIKSRGPHFIRPSEGIPALLEDNMTRRNSFSRGDGSMKVLPIVHQRKESEIGVDFDQGIDLGATEFHTSHDELNETIAESRPSLFASLGLTTSKVADGGKGGAFETIEETEDEKGKEPPNRQMNHSIFIARTSRFLAAMASIAVSIGTIAGAMKGKKPNRSDVEVPDGREDDENEGRKGILEKMNRRMAAFASIVASAAIIVGATSHYWASDPYFGNAMCEKDEECKSGVLTVEN